MTPTQPIPRMADRIPLSEAHRLYFTNADGRAIVSRQQLNEWIISGVAGIRLPAERIGLRWFVTGDDVHRFLGEVQAALSTELGSPGRPYRRAQARTPAFA